MHTQTVEFEQRLKCGTRVYVEAEYEFWDNCDCGNQDQFHNHIDGVTVLSVIDERTGLEIHVTDELAAELSPWVREHGYRALAEESEECLV